MITFHNGPADQKLLQLRRAPALLRVVINAAGDVDALDQLDDVPQDGETVHVYKIRGASTGYHLCIRGKNRAAGGWYRAAEYEYLSTPEPAECRTLHAWAKLATSLFAVHFPAIADRDENETAGQRAAAENRAKRKDGDA